VHDTYYVTRLGFSGRPSTSAPYNGPSPNRPIPHLESFASPDPTQPPFLHLTHLLCTQVPTHRKSRPHIQSTALSSALPIPNLTAVFHKTKNKCRWLHTQVGCQSSSFPLTAMFSPLPLAGITTQNRAGRTQSSLRIGIAALVESLM
jgi:hypothetical protein